MWSIIKYYCRKVVYTHPMLFHFVLKAIESNSPNRDSKFWDNELACSKEFYLSGTLHIRCRSSIIAQMISNDNSTPLRILDIGCASGELLSTLLNKSVEMYMGVDISQYAIEYARKKFARDDDMAFNASFTQSDLCLFNPKKNTTFDVIVFNEVLYYLGIDEAVRQVNRYAEWLKPEGTICVSMKKDSKSRLLYTLILKDFHVTKSVLMQISSDGTLRYGAQESKEPPPFAISLIQKNR